MVNFKKYLIEASMEEYGDLLDDVVSLLDATGGKQVWVKNGGDKVIIAISGENYVESDMNGDVIKTQKIYKDGEVTNYDLAISRLKALKSAIENEQFVEEKGE